MAKHDREIIERKIDASQAAHTARAARFFRAEAAKFRVAIARATGGGA